MPRSRTVDITSVERGKHDKGGRQRCLIEAATQVFAEKGFDAATTRAVAELAGCSEGLIHRYFGGKRGLLIAILDQKANEVMEDRARSLPLCASLTEEIEQLLFWPMEQYWQKRAFMRVSVAQAAIDPEVGHTIGDRLNHEQVLFISERLRAHQGAGRVRDDVDIPAIAMAISAMNFAIGFFAQVAFGMDRDRLRREARATARVLARGLATETHAVGEGSGADPAPTIVARAGRRALAAGHRSRGSAAPKARGRVVRSKTSQGLASVNGAASETTDTK